MSYFIILTCIVAVILWVVSKLLTEAPSPLPEVDLSEWWGTAIEDKTEDTNIRPFKIQFHDEMISDLRDRLKNHRKWTPPLEGISFEYGFNSARLDTWVDYWATKYDFKAREDALNKYPQFKTKTQGLDIHFIRVRPENTKKEVVPLLLLHGWPGSVREFYESIPLLTADSKDRDFVLELIIPSIPGYGFSDPAARPGLGTTQVAVVFRNLMHRLGHKKYYIQGGDWGSAIGSNMATLFQDEVLGYHANMAFLMTRPANVLSLIGSICPSLVIQSRYKDRMYPLSDHWAFKIEESGYMHIQATKPDTVGVGLNDSPVALLAYILEKFSTWTNKEFKNLPDGGLSKKFTKDKLIDNLMLYWVPNSITTSMRLYAENSSKMNSRFNLQGVPTRVPTWILAAKHELFFHPPSILKYKYHKFVNMTYLDDGGHFLAFEMPNEFSKDVLEALSTFRTLKQ